MSGLWAEENHEILRTPDFFIEKFKQKFWGGGGEGVFLMTLYLPFNMQWRTMVLRGRRTLRCVLYTVTLRVMCFILSVISSFGIGKCIVDVGVPMYSGRESCIRGRQSHRISVCSARTL